MTSVGEERAVFSAIDYLILLFLFERVSLPLGAWEWLRYSIAV